MRPIHSSILILLLLSFLIWITFENLSFLGNGKSSSTEQAIDGSFSKSTASNTDKTPLSDGEKVIQALKGKRANETREKAEDRMANETVDKTINENSAKTREDINLEEKSIAELSEEENTPTEALTKAPLEEVEQTEPSKQYPKNSTADNSTPKPQVTPNTSTPQAFLVIAGSYSIVQNAKAQAERMKKLGFDKTEIVQFRGRQYHSICIDRFVHKKEAQKLLAQLKKQGLKGYIHRMKAN